VEGGRKKETAGTPFSPHTQTPKTGRFRANSVGEVPGGEGAVQKRGKHLELVLPYDRQEGRGNERVRVREESRTELRKDDHFISYVKRRGE